MPEWPRPPPAPPSVGAPRPRIVHPLVQPEGPPPEVSPTPTVAPEPTFDARDELGPRYGDLPSEPTPASGAAGGTEPVATPAAAAAEPVARKDATLHLAYRNRLGSATMTVLVDGEVVLSRDLEASANPLTRAFGDELLETVKVPSGEREIEVRVRGRSMDVEASASLSGRFDPGGRRWLRITLNPFAEKVTLAWAGE